MRDMEKKRATDRAYRTRKRIEARSFIWDFKNHARCEECGSVWDLEFHHRDPALKRYKISRMVQQGRSLKTVWKEMEKCAMLCHHCHRIHHDGDGGYWESPADTEWGNEDECGGGIEVGGETEDSGDEGEGKGECVGGCEADIWPSCLQRRCDPFICSPSSGSISTKEEGVLA